MLQDQGTAQVRHISITFIYQLNYGLEQEQELEAGRRERALHRQSALDLGSLERPPPYRPPPPYTGPVRSDCESLV